MRILFTRFPLESAYGGAEVQTISLMKGLMERGHAVAFAGSCPVLLELCRKEHIPYADVDIGIPPVTAWLALSFAWRKKRMRKMLLNLINSFGDESIDGEVTSYELRVMSDPQPTTHNPQLDIVCMLSLSEKLLITEDIAAAGVKVLWIEHDRIGRWLIQNPWLPLLLKQSVYATTVPVSHLSADLYKNLGWDASTIRAIPNGIDEKRVMVSPTNHDVKHATLRRAQGDRSMHLLCIARLSPEKGVDVLIEAMAGLPDSFTLEVAGTGKEEKTLKDLTRKLKLSERITFSGYQKNLEAAYARANALVLPSRDNDPFGLVAAEAMMQGIPVVITDQCGIAGYLEDGVSALIAHADSVSALKDAINRLPAEGGKIALEGKKTAQEKFSVKRMVEDYEHVFTESLPLTPSR